MPSVISLISRSESPTFLYCNASFLAYLAFTWTLFFLKLYGRSLFCEVYNERVKMRRLEMRVVRVFLGEEAEITKELPQVAIDLII